MKLTKEQQIEKWLEANPGKTTKDFLLEVRCPDEASRKAMENLLDALDVNGINYGIFTELKNYKSNQMQQNVPLNGIDSVVFDLMIAPGIGHNSWLIEADMPDEVLGKQIEKTRGTYEAIPAEAFAWLLSQWCPDFEINSIDEKQYRKLMWEDMGGFLGKVIGNRGFAQWKDPKFAQKVVETYLRDKSAAGC
ncbi:MAG: hypothetical protein K2N28_07015 [Muribaculaceae bacterium]|nr:hypothetical protein [Muribaculaceae bacterium]